MLLDLALILLSKLKVIFNFDDDQISRIVIRRKLTVKKIAFSINDVSQVTGVPSHTIRFWEKDFNLYLRPAKTPGGQRRYCNKDIEIIRTIKHLRYQDKYTIAGTIKELERNRNKKAKDVGNRTMEGDIPEMPGARNYEEVGENV